MSQTKQKILIIGGSGLIGSRFLELCQADFVITAPNSKELNITSLHDLREIVRQVKPQIVINFAAYTNVSEAESQRGDLNGACWQLTVEGAKNVAAATAENGGGLVHISTDYVFDGINGPYREDDARADSADHASWYGWSKRLAEDEVTSVIQDNLLIVRPAFPFRASFDRKTDFVRTILSKLETNSLYPMFSDQFITPTFIDQFCTALTLLIQAQEKGVYHIVTKGEMSPYSAAQAVAEVFGYDPSSVQQGSREVYVASKADDPYAPYRYAKNTALKTDKLESFLSQHNAAVLTLKQALVIMRDQLKVA